ncbi:hypothetical protein HUK65_06610 [Rhodobacteraceae bacterium 2376]|uniref:Tetratricopeptide repeat protein n=1 Tax=Rhabdonatronobacter sediminivivens TaxID=2743469 RepID=A0A7Z0HYL5_9RHOB|nr:hypothetical protein [Rhabdonatronobacter sediminivivens]NYS24660.1 hypothetical protein [Rhabdonatronobacter sediminivivens]
MCSHLTSAPRLAAAVLLSALLALAPQTAPAQTATQEDLRALVFYLQQDDQPAVQAELRRLRAQFPDWRPPATLSELVGTEADGGGPDVAGIWQRIDRQDFAGARRMIDQTRRAHPDWTPDGEMLRILELNEAQARFDAAVAARNAPDAIAVARRTPQLMRCDRINNAWGLAEMYHLAGQTANAVATYRSTLGSCQRLADMEPTLEKADAVASPAQMAELFSAARQAAPQHRDQLDRLEQRLRAGRGGGSTGSAPAPTAQRSPAPSAAPAPAAAAGAMPAGAPTSFDGLPLRGDARVSEVRAAKEAENWSRCFARSAAPRSLELLYERSWCALAHDRPAEALAGFAAVAQRGGALGGNIPRDVRYGLALAHLSLQMTEEGARIAGTANLTDAQRLEVETIVLDQRGVRAFRLGEFRQAIASFDALEQSASGGLRRDLAIMRAYAHLNTGQRGTAHAQFQRLHDQLTTAETRAGLDASRGGP